MIFKKLNKINSNNIIGAFSIIEDPRIERSKKFPLINVLIFAFIAILSDQSSWYQIEEFCKENLNWFSRFLDISNGAPSHDTFRRVFSIIETKQFEKAVITWIDKTRAKNGVKNRVIALDGKSLRGFSWKVNLEKLHILNAWDCTHNKFLGQISVESKTNEITAAPKLLNLLNIENSIITVDAMMTQTTIAKTIANKKGDYVMALKGNQKTLFEDVKLYFTEIEKGMSSSRTVEKNRGQVEIRICTKTENIKWLDHFEKWKNFKTIFQVESQIYKDGKTRKEKRLYITSLNYEASKLLKIARQHWSVENQLHRTLDVHFKEDKNQEHNKNAAANLSILRKLSISLLKQIEPKKTLISKLKKAAYSGEFRKKCLLGF